MQNMRVSTSIEELVSQLVSPADRSKVQINMDHLTMLHGTKNKKQLSRKKPASKSKTLTRREYAALGLYTLPTKQMRYEEALPLHRLWKGYIREHLNLSNGDTVPQPHDRNYDEFGALLAKMDFHGAQLRVVDTKCATLMGVGGIVVLETKNTLKMIDRDNTVRTVPKRQCVFGMRVGNMEMTIFGSHMCQRPAERSIRKCKTFIEAF